MQLILAYDSKYQSSVQANLTSPVRAWCLLNDAGNVEKSGLSETLAEITVQTQGLDFATIVLIMSPDVLVTQIPRPAGTLRKLQQALPFLLEEQLADDVEDLHFAVLNNDPKTLVIGVINREILQNCINELTAANLQPQVIMPLWLSLPEPAPDHWQIFVTEDYVWLRMAAFSGFCVERPFAASFFEALNQKSPPVQIDCVTTDILDPAVLEQYQALNVTTNTTVLTDPEHWIDYIAKNLPKGNVSLLQGEFSTSQRSGEEQRWWTLAQRLAVSLVVVWFSGMFLQYLYLSWQYNKLENEIAVVYREVFPDAKTITNPRGTFDREIARVAGGQAGSDFLSMLLRTGEILADFPQITLQNVSYRDKKITLNFTTDNFSRLQQLEDRFNQAGIKVDKESAVSSKGIVQATWRVG